jgi:hypothetical protein
MHVAAARRTAKRGLWPQTAFWCAIPRGSNAQPRSQGLFL